MNNKITIYFVIEVAGLCNLGGKNELVINSSSSVFTIKCVEWL